DERHAAVVHARARAVTERLHLLSGDVRHVPVLSLESCEGGGDQLSPPPRGPRGPRRSPPPRRPRWNSTSTRAPPSPPRSAPPSAPRNSRRRCWPSMHASAIFAVN